MSVTERQIDNEKQLDYICPGCGAEMEPFYTFKNVPTNSCILMDSEAEARQYPRGDIILGFCNSCGFIRNLAFFPELTEYTGKYEETQGYSPTFQKFHSNLAKDLINRYSLHDKTVLEIGCGKGEFLAMLCEQGPNKGLGFDPGFDNDRNILQGLSGVKVIKDFYSSEYKQHQANFVCCKMTLEHIQDTADFVGLSRQALIEDESSIFYLQVPESLRILKDCAFEDIYYEHCSYFTPGSLARLFRGQDLQVMQLYTQYKDQYLAIEACLGQGDKLEQVPEENDLDQVRNLVKSFSERCDTKIRQWQAELKSLASHGSVVLWGSGSKAVSFLSMIDQDQIVEKVVDINPFRQGHFMPGTGQPIIAPEGLLDEPPAAVIIMNPVYLEEIVRDLQNRGISAKVLTL